MFEAIFRNRSGPVLIIGGAGVDIVGRVRSELKPAGSTPGQIRTSYGGVARNIAENLARLGQDVILFTAVGADAEGEGLVKGLKQAGVNTKSIRVVENCSTGSYLAVINSSGELQVALDDMSVINFLTPEVIEENQSLFREASLVFVDGNLPKESLRKVFSLAHKNQIQVCADPTSTALAARFKSFLPRLCVFTPNASEAAVLLDPSVKIITRKQALQAAKELVSRGVKIVIITLGQMGLCYASSESSGYIPAMQTTVVDPTGAGDALTATVIFALLNEIPIDDAVRLGVSAATLTLQTRGAVVQDLSLDKLYDRLVI